MDRDLERRARAVLEELRLRLQRVDRADGIFDAVEAYWDRAYTITGTVRPEGLVGWQFTPGLFAMLGTPPAIGRTFTRADGEVGRDNLVVLSDGLWRRRFDARADVVGTAVELDGRTHTIVGVMPPVFTHPYPSRSCGRLQRYRARRSKIASNGPTGSLPACAKG